MSKISYLRLHKIRRYLGSCQTISGPSDKIVDKNLGHKSKAAKEVYASMNLDPFRDSMNKVISLIKDYKS